MLKMSIQSKKLTEKLTPYFFILPAGLFLITIIGYPVIYTIFMSFQKFTLETLVSKQPQFIGFENYGLHLVFGPIYVVLAVMFIILYLINMFSRK